MDGSSVVEYFPFDSSPKVTDLPETPVSLRMLGRVLKRTLGAYWLSSALANTLVASIANTESRIRFFEIIETGEIMLRVFPLSSKFSLLGPS